MSHFIKNSPSVDGFYMPSENQPQKEIWMAWPVRGDNWRLGAKPAQEAFIQVAETISKTTQVVMLVPSHQFSYVRERLSVAIRVVEMSYNDCWMRDIGATYVVNSKGLRRAINWKFNAWGGLEDGLYFPWDLDDVVAEKMCNLTGDDGYKADFVLEGGAFHTDGEGTLYTTEECLLHLSRNPHLSKMDIEKKLQCFLGVEKVIWLPKGLYNDETNGHVDNLLHVVKPGEVALTWCEDVNDPQYEISQTALDVLKRTKDAKGRDIKVHKLPMPGPLFLTQEEAEGIEVTSAMNRQAGERLAASYANFLITNGQVVFPLLDSVTDKRAQIVLEQAFPEYSVVGVPTREILLGGGNIHCITQQVPLCPN